MSRGAMTFWAGLGGAGQGAMQGIQMLQMLKQAALAQQWHQKEFDQRERAHNDEMNRYDADRAERERAAREGRQTQLTISGRQSLDSDVQGFQRELGDAHFSADPNYLRSILSQASTPDVSVGTGTGGRGMNLQVPIPAEQIRQRSGEQRQGLFQEAAQGLEGLQPGQARPTQHGMAYQPREPALDASINRDQDPLDDIFKSLVNDPIKLATLESLSQVDPKTGKPGSQEAFDIINAFHGWRARRLGAGSGGTGGSHTVITSGAGAGAGTNPNPQPPVAPPSVGGQPAQPDTTRQQISTLRQKYDAAVAYIRANPQRYSNPDAEIAKLGLPPGGRP